MFCLYAMSAIIDAKFSFLNGHHGPGARKGHHVVVPTPLERARSEPSLGDGTLGGLISPIGAARGKSLPGMGIPAGFSPILGNRLGHAAYANLSGRYVARMDVPPPCRAPRPPPPNRAEQVEQTWQAPQRLKPETLPPAGGMNPRIRGKAMIADNTNNLSTVDTLIFGRDVDGSNGCRSMADTYTYSGCAGLNPKVERDPAWGQVPPVCKRTFGEDPNDDSWNQVQYTRLDPRRDYAEL